MLQRMDLLGQMLMSIESHLSADPFVVFAILPIVEQSDFQEGGRRKKNL